MTYKCLCFFVLFAVVIGAISLIFNTTELFAGYCLIGTMLLPIILVIEILITVIEKAKKNKID